MSPPGRAGGCGPWRNSLWPVPAVCVTRVGDRERSFPLGAAGRGQPPASGGGAAPCAFPRDSAQQNTGSHADREVSLD